MVARAGELVVPPWPMDVRGVQPVAASRRRVARAREVVADAALLLAVAYSLPFVIILAGALWFANSAKKGNLRFRGRQRREVSQRGDADRAASRRGSG